MAPDEVAGPSRAEDERAPVGPDGRGSPWMRPQLPRLPGPGVLGATRGVAVEPPGDPEGSPA